MTLDPPALQPDPAPDQALACRAGCGACCIAPSISSAIPGMPHGKPAGVRCVQLDDALRCRSLRLLYYFTSLACWQSHRSIRLPSQATNCPLLHSENVLFLEV